MAVNWQEIDNNITLDAFYTTGAYHDMFKFLRAEDPVHWTDNSYGRPLWHVTRYEDVVRVQTEADAFSSKYGGNLPPDPRAIFEFDQHEMGYGAIPTFTDAPNHLPYRQPFNKYFTVHTVAKMTAAIQQIIDEIISEVGPRGSCDLANDVAAQLPLRLILQLMGIPKNDWAMMAEMANAIMESEDPDYRRPGRDPSESKFAAFRELHEYLKPLADERRKNPKDDWISLIASMTTEGEPWDMWHVYWWSWTVVVGGLDTTRNAVASAMQALLTNPDQADLIRANPSVMDTATEEFLRWSTPSKHILRVATRDIELRGKKIKKDDWVVAWSVSGNRDETVFKNPDNLDVTRSPNPHLSFGATTSPHFCLGRNLGRLELRMMVHDLITRFEDMEIDGDVKWLASSNVTALKHLPVRFKPMAK